MSVSRTLLEISLILYMLMVFIGAVIFLVDPTWATVMGFVQYCKYPLLFLALSVFVCAKAVPCSRTECIGYGRAVLLLYGGLLTAVGLPLVLTSSSEHFGNNLSVLFAGLLALGISHAIKRWTGVSCIPQLKSLSIFCGK